MCEDKQEEAGKSRQQGVAGGAEEDVHLSDRLRKMADGLCRPIRFQTFCLGRFGVGGGFSLNWAGGEGVRELAGARFVSLLWWRRRRRLGLRAIRGDCLRGSGGLVSASGYRSSAIKDLSLRGWGEDSVRGQGGGLWRFAMV